MKNVLLRSCTTVQSKLQSVTGNILHLLNTTQTLENVEAPPIDRCSFTRNIMNIDKLLLSADQFTCDLGIPYWTKPCRWETHIRTSERRQTSVAGGGGCCRLPWTLPLPEPRFSTYVHVGRWWTRRMQQGRRERSQRPNPMVDPSFRRQKKKWSIHPMERPPWSARRPAKTTN